MEPSSRKTRTSDLVYRIAGPLEGRSRPQTHCSGGNAVLNPGRFLFITLLTVFASALAAGSEPVLYCADYAEAGDVVQLVVSGGDLEDIVVSLRDSSDRAVSRTEGFLWTTPTGRTASVALLGVPVSAVSGRYRVVLDARQGRAEWRLEKTVSVVRPEFRETVVEMDGTMDALYSDESERKKAEARTLWSVLTSFDGRALFHMGPLIRPLDEAVRTAGFGDRRRYRSPEGAETAAIHFGEDYGAEKGTPVRASGSGRVMMASERLMTGNTVVSGASAGCVYAVLSFGFHRSTGRGENGSGGYSRPGWENRFRHRKSSALGTSCRGRPRESPAFSQSSSS